MRGDKGSATQIDRGSMMDRPWGLTLGELGVALRSVQLTLRSDEKIFRINFDRGVIISAISPVPADSVARVALTSQLITPAQVNDVKRRIAEAPNADEVDALAAVVRLTAEQTRALRTKLLTQRAARTFSVERGDFAIEERTPLPVVAKQVGVDVRTIVYAGARLNLSELRLALDLRQFGTRFALKPEVIDELPRYGFTRTERPVLEALRRGTSVPELEANQRDLDPRIAMAVIYALASCDALISLDQATAVARTMTPAEIPLLGLTPTPQADRKHVV
jgi:hypothetical protein